MHSTLTLTAGISMAGLARSASGLAELAVLPMFVLLSLAGCGPSQANYADADWTSHNGGHGESAYSGLDEIAAVNAGRIGLAWSLDLDGEQTLEATPLAVEGILYFTGGTSKVYAVNGPSGKLLWTYDPEIHKHRPDHQRLIFPVNRGAAWWAGKVYAGTIDGRLIALDGKTGRLIWSVDTVMQGSRQTITGAPRAFGGKIVIGNGGADRNARGYVTAYDADSGRQLWRFHTVPGDPAEDGDDTAMRMAAKTWSAGHWRSSGGGGTVWDSMTYDPLLNRLYIGVGNGGPYNPATRSPGNGDNLFLASIVALDADSGKYVWHYQVNPREAWDYKATTNMVAATLTIGGKSRDVLMQAPTNGFFYVLDRQTGKLLSAEKLGKVTWASHIDLKTGRPVELPGIRYDKGPADIWPSPYGAHNWQTMSYSPQTGLVYIPYMQLGARYSAQPAVGADGKILPLGGVSISPLIRDREDGRGALVAWDPQEQKIRWKVQHASLWNGGTMATAGGLVFQGDADGNFAAFDARDGRRLWNFRAGLGIVAAPVTFEASGRQYVSVLVGYGGATTLWPDIVNRGWKYGLQPRRLLTFALDGKAKLPRTPPPDRTVRALDDPKLKIDPILAAEGTALYGNECVTCHGGGLRSAGAPGPDLRESGIALDVGALTTLLRGGALAANGMPRFTELTDRQILGLYMYIRAGARTAGDPVLNEGRKM
ncbi:PQQ-dependent dehydrogenase, methanol/ethanol family [Sphingopyxis bauzanensis]|uniref:PQQ-dependent dehydrogenase, methanol/ethanol family n=2 Tax=Sphingopyxis bauzanensis TaxID=651663 RepID=A0A246JR23_9SPHN|nr:PQQ-dependent dehydrogenase, methanol/ethanol family [Sphingopyxis bauzanensis]